MAKMLVTGGAGFIGGHLVNRLIKDGNQVIVVDDFTERKMRNLPQVSSQFQIYRLSILEEFGIESLFEGVDVVFHLAALPRPQLSIIDLKPAHRTNVDGTLSVLLGCKNYGVKRMVFASSASIYGEQPVYPCKEDAEPNPMSPYALHKLIGEQYCKLFTNIYGVETNCLRFFNVYGTYMNPDSKYSAAIPRFIKLVRQGISPTINGTGKQARDSVYVDDVVEAMILASECDTYGEVFNVGTGVNLSVTDLFYTICKKLGKSMEPLYGPAVIEPSQTLADITKSASILGWRPTIFLDEGLDRTING